MRTLLRNAAKSLLQQTIGRLPGPAARLTGPLAVKGGTPVRNQRYRPWRTARNGSAAEWYTSVGPSMRRVFAGGAEGLPQTLQKEFARRWADYCGCKHALMLPHGTDALRLALAAVFDTDGLEYSGEVIVPNLSFIASATAPLDRRFSVAFVDVDPGTLNLDPRRVEEAIIPGRTRAILPVHQFGQPADMTALLAISRKHGLKVIEDAAQAHGSEWETGMSGTLGDAGAFSFQSAKNLHAGEGGMLTTNDSAVFERAYSLHNAGRSLEAGSRWEHVRLGWNCRPTEYQAALLLHRFSSFESKQAIRLKNFSFLRSKLERIRCVEPLAVHPGVRRHGMYMFVLRYHAERCDGLPIDEFLRLAGAEGAPFNRCYASTMSEQQAMKRIQERNPEYIRVLPTPVSDRAAKEILYIPADVFLGNEGDMTDIAAILRKLDRCLGAAA
jgi:dTDP-4-amino-4,6-dideoxygalactose transaminase